VDPTRTQFVSDAKDLVDRLYVDLQQLRALRAQGRQRRELASRIFRHVHTLKGTAASMGFQSVGEVAHEFESVLDGVRLGRVAIDDASLNLFESATDLIAEELASTAKPDDRKTQALLARLHALAANASKKAVIAGSLRSALPEDIARSLSEYDVQHAREAVREGAKLFIVDASFSIDTFDTQFRDLTTLLGKSGEVIATVPGRAPKPEEISFRLLYAAQFIADQIRLRAAELGTIGFTELPIAVPDTSAAPTPSVPLSQPVDSSIASVRVGLNQLDDLTSAVTDLLRDTNKALFTVQRTADADAVTVATANLRRRFVQLEERLIKLRLVPLSELLNAAAARAGRVAARQLGKDIEFEIIGGEIGIDKSLAELIAEPLMHLVRNAVGHGIESTEERLAKGKPPNGRVCLEGFREGSRIHIVITDDGRGIELGEVANAAARQGIVGRPEELSEDQALRLIFRPGFSTSAEASDISGRGVGLEIVDRAMTQAGGEVRLSSQPGKGAVFAMMVPATLALVPCVVVRCGENFYCFDSNIVADCATLTEDDFRQNGDGGSMKWQDEELPMLRLSDLLASSPVPANGARSLLICKPCDRRSNVSAHHHGVALLVDAIAGQQETLVRSLGPHAMLWHGVSGAAELLDGSIALMIDLARLIEANESGLA
jgi:two-component system, chemotaxis family, sensor kinase CheA